MALVTKHFNCGYGRKPEVKYRGNCLNSTILVTNLETRTLEGFSPSLMLIWVLKSSQYSKIRVAHHWGRRGVHLRENKGVKIEFKKFPRKFKKNGFCFNDL